LPPSGQPPPLVDTRRAIETVRILLLLDQEVLAPVVALALSHGAFVTRTVEKVPAALTALETWQPHLAIVNMDTDGGAFLTQVRIVRPLTGLASLPVIALTRRGDLKTTLDTFERGVDDLLTLPLSPEELLARTRAVLRRTYGQLHPVIPVIRRGELEIDILNRRVRVGEHLLYLTPLEQSLLYLLAANDGRVLTRDEIMDYLWGGEFVAESNVVDRHVRNLRAKLQNSWRAPRYIITIPGQGYSFVPKSEDERGPSTGYPRAAASPEP
jgi:two-component system, OmpR family, KDP operon response regulator KdpE